MRCLQYKPNDEIDKTITGISRKHSITDFRSQVKQTRREQAPTENQASSFQEPITMTPGANASLLACFEQAVNAPPIQFPGFITKPTQRQMVLQVGDNKWDL